MIESEVLKVRPNAGAMLDKNHFDKKRMASSLSRPATPVKTLKVPSISITSKFSKHAPVRKQAASISRKKTQNKSKHNFTLNEILGYPGRELFPNEENRSLEISTRCQTVVSERMDTSSSLASLEEPPSSCRTFKVPPSLSSKDHKSGAAPPSLFAKPALRLRQLI